MGVMSSTPLTSSPIFRMLVAAFVLVVGIIGFQTCSNQAGAEAPQIDAVALDGRRVSLADLRGKVVLIDFWATWCRPCVQEIPHVREAYERYNAEGFEVIGVSLDRQRQDLESFIARQRLAWPQILEAENRGAGQPSSVYGVRAIPHTVLVGRDGRIVATDLRGSSLSSAVAKALAVK